MCLCLPIGIVKKINICPAIPITNKNHNEKLLIARYILIIIPQNIPDKDIYTHIFLNQRQENTKSSTKVSGIVKIKVNHTLLTKKHAGFWCIWKNRNEELRIRNEELGMRN